MVIAATEAFKKKRFAIYGYSEGSNMSAARTQTRKDRMNSSTGDKQSRANKTETCPQQR